MTWCELCRDHYEEDHFTEDWPPVHKRGPAYGPTGADIVSLSLVDLIIGENAVLWDHGERSFEVRRDGKHAGFLEVTEQGEVIWIA